MDDHKDDINKPMETAFDRPPKWAQEAIWYQILVERFRNGNLSNDPSPSTCQNALIDPLPSDWELMEWGANWYQQTPWEQGTGLDFYRTVQMRRYGGDLDGVIDKIPYLKSLGVNALYFNPINDAPSLHKYDARHYHHIDVTFGDDIVGDIALMASEDHNDPSTWTWTSADKKFLKLVDLLHQEGMRVVLDFSWNHTGNNFWAFKDVEANLEQSLYKDWYITKFRNDPKTGETKFDYEGWYGISNLPELKKIDSEGKIAGHPYEGNINTEVKKHIFDVSRRWMDPNGNGDLSKGIDGMRLDVAEHVPLGFWRDFRKFVRSINSDFYLVGENWWTEWPDVLMDPMPWVQGDVFDAVMHYQWFKVARGYFAQPNDRIDLVAFRTAIDSIYDKYEPHTAQAMMNLASSHDSPRLLTSFFNVNKYKFHCKPQEDPQYRTNQPGEITYHKTKLFLLHQFTFIGAPHIWNGDEMGMRGADDPDNRKPLIWEDITFEPETQSANSDYKYQESVAFDKDMFGFYQAVITLRKSSPAFTYGHYAFVNLDEDHNVLAYYRYDANERFLIIFNNNSTVTTFDLPLDYNKFQLVFQYNGDFAAISRTLEMPDYSGLVLKCE